MNFNLKKRECLVLAHDSAQILTQILSNNMTHGFDSESMKWCYVHMDRIKELLEEWKMVK